MSIDTICCNSPVHITNSQVLNNYQKPINVHFPWYNIFISKSFKSFKSQWILNTCHVFPNLTIYREEKKDPKLITQSNYFLLSKSFDCFNFLSLITFSKRFFWGMRLLKVRRLLVFEAVYRDLLGDSRYPIRENSLPELAEPARMEKI